MQEAAASTRRARRQVLEEMNIMAELGEREIETWIVGEVIVFGREGDLDWIDERWKVVCVVLCL
jgi:hypothetical protein